MPGCDEAGFGNRQFEVVNGFTTGVDPERFLGGVSLRFLGSVPLPKILSADPELADTLTDYHVWVAWGPLGLVVAHVGQSIDILEARDVRHSSGHDSKT